MEQVNRHPKVLCAGDLVADIFSTSVDRLPQSGELTLTDTIAIFPGGNALNTSIALRKLGVQVAIAGSIGDDFLGDILIKSIQNYGLDISGIHRESGETTASTIILRVKGEDRRYLHSLGVSGNFTGKHIQANCLPNDGIVMIGGYLKLAAWDDEILVDFLKQAKRRNNQVVLNVCYAQDSKADPKRCFKLMNYVDYFILNESEASLITGEKTLNAQIQTLRNAGADCIIITRGSKGLFAGDGKSVVEMSSYQVQVIDPSGCGDSFNAGLIAALSRGWEFSRMLKFASAVGAFSATSLGCTSGVPSIDIVESFLEENWIDIKEI